MGQDQVFGGENVLLASRTRCKCSMKTSLSLIIMSKLVIRSSSVTISRFSEMSDKLRIALYMIMSQNVMWDLGDGDSIMFDEIPISTIELPERQFQTFPDISLLEKLHESHTTLRIKFIKGASSGIPFELCGKTP